MKITLPKTITQAKKALSGLGALLTAKEWERAAIVYAFTDPGKNQYASGNSTRHTIIGFTRLGIAGLTYEETVRAYRKAWEGAMEDGAAEAAPGATITLPTLPFPENPRSTRGTVASVRAAIRKGTVNIADVVGDNPDLREKVAEQVASNDDLRNATVNKYFGTAIPTGVTRGKSQPTPVNWNVTLWHGLNEVMDALRAWKAGEFTLDAFNSQMLGLMEHALPEVVTQGGAGNPTIFDDIDTFLKQVKEAQS